MTAREQRTQRTARSSSRRSNKAAPVRRTSTKAGPARRTGRPHLVALPGGKDSRSREFRGTRGARKGKSKPLRTPKRRRNDKKTARVASTLFVPLSRPLSSSGVRFVATASAVLMAFIFGLVMLHILSAQASFRLEGLHERVEREEARYRKMRYEVASAESPARIADAAKGLGMVAPAERRYIVGPGGGEDEPSPQVAGRPSEGSESGSEQLGMKALLSSNGSGGH